MPTEGYFWYEETDGEVQIISCNNITATGYIDIPSTLGGYPVTSLGLDCFRDCTGVTGVSIPSSITYMDDNIFKGCTSLTGVSFPSTYIEIGNNLFDGCTSLINISLPNWITNMSYWFWNCTSLQEVNIPTAMTSISTYAFCNTALTEIIIPEGITTISNWAFAQCTSLTKITLPSTLTTINSGAFRECTSLTNIELPPSLTGVITATFYGCTALTSIIIPESVTVVNNNTFYGCSSLNTITFYSSETSIYGGSATIPASTIIIAYDPSKAKTYATTYNRTFQALSRLSQVSRPKWSGYNLTWEDVSDANSYIVRLRQGGVVTNTLSVAAGKQMCDLLTVFAAGTYTATVQASEEAIS